MEEIILTLAKVAILVALDEPTDFNLTSALSEYPQLKEQGAVFVTLRKEGALRGCIGSLQAHRPLYRDIISNAQSSALRDSRFVPLRKEELPKIKIEVSLLSKPQKVDYKNQDDLKEKIRANIDGVVLEIDNHRATYLPSVWEELPKFDQFFGSLCLKAKLDKNCLAKHPNISIYQATKYKEK